MLFNIVGLGLVGTAMIIVIKQYKPEYSMFISVLIGIFILGILMLNIIPLLDKLTQMIEITGNEYTDIIFKTLGICFITQFACDTCRDAGETAIASKIEVGGKISILILSVPLFEKILTIVYSLLSQT